MINEQIEKRFLFDLELGVFKACTCIINGIEYNKKTYSFYAYDSNLGIYNLCDLLKNIGYKTNKDIYEFTPSKHKTILIYPENKRYSIESKMIKNNNPVPNYIYNYQPYLKEG